MDTDLKKVKVKEDICTNLKQGLFKKDAARMAGISEDTYLRWYKEDAGFADKVEASILEYKQSLIKNLNIQAEKNGMLALKILQWRFPKDWAEPQREENEERRADTKRVADALQALLNEPDEEETAIKDALVKQEEDESKGQEFFS